MRHPPFAGAQGVLSSRSYKTSAETNRRAFVQIVDGGSLDIDISQAVQLPFGLAELIVLLASSGKSDRLTIVKVGVK